MLFETDDELRPLPNAVRHARLAFGQNVLRRANTTHRASVVREDLEAIGAQGLISLIAALVASGDYTEDELLDEGDRICGPRASEAFEALLAELEGTDPFRHVWTVTKGGTYRLTTKL